MSLRGLLVLIVLLAAVVAWLIGSVRTPHVPAEPARTEPILAPFAGDAVTAIAAACAPEAWTLRRDALGWRVAEPFEAEADARRVEDILAALQDARALKEVAGADSDPSAFGLAPALCRVEVTVGKDPAPRVLRLGRTNPVGMERYAMGASGRIVLTDGTLFGLFARNAEALRERRLFPMAQESVTRVAIERPQGRLVLEADGDLWRLVEPFKDAASSGACRDLVRAIVTLELDDARAAVGPVPSRRDRRIAVEVTASGPRRTELAYLATAGIEGKRLGWRAGGGLIGLLPESAARELDNAADIYRDKRVAVLSTPDIRWVALERAGRAVRIERSDEGAAWIGRDGDAPFVPDATRVEEFLARLRSLVAAGFEATTPTPASGTIAVGGVTGELVRVTWGSLPPAPGAAGEELWLTTPSRPGVVFRVPAADLGRVPADAADWMAGP